MRKLLPVAVGTTCAVLAALLAPSESASAAHVGTVAVSPRTDIAERGTCNPFEITTRGGASPAGARVDFEIRSVEADSGTAASDSVAFCLPAPAANFNEVLATAGDGDLGGGADGTIGGEALTQDDPNTIAIEGVVTFGIRSPVSGTYDIRVFVEEPAGDNGNDDHEADEPGTSAIGIFTAEGGHTGVADRSAAARVQALGLQAGEELEVRPDHPQVHVQGNKLVWRASDQRTGVLRRGSGPQPAGVRADAVRQHRSHGDSELQLYRPKRP